MRNIVLFHIAQQFAVYSESDKQAHRIQTNAVAKLNAEWAFVFRRLPRNSRSNYVMCGPFAHCNLMLKHVVIVLMQTNITANVIIIILSFFVENL